MAPPNLYPPHDPLVLEQIGAVEPAVRRHLARAAAEHLALDHPEQALALLDTLDEPPCALQISILSALGRQEQAVIALAAARRLSGASERGRISVEAATLAKRRNQPKEAIRLLQEGLRFATQPEVRGAALVRLGVMEIERGNTQSGLRALAEATTLLDGCGAVRLSACARIEEGLYRLMLGESEQGGALLHRAIHDTAHQGVSYLERIARAGASLAHRLLGQSDEAENERRHLSALHSERDEEPGVFALTAMERRLAGDRAGAAAALSQGLARHETLPNPTDAALLLSLRAAWEGSPAQQLPRETPPFARALLHAARRDPAGAKLARRIGQRLPERLVAVFRER